MVLNSPDLVELFWFTQPNYTQPQCDPTKPGYGPNITKFTLLAFTRRRRQQEENFMTWFHRLYY